MPIVGEWCTRVHHVATGWHGATYEINMSPGNVLAKIGINFIHEHTRTRDDVPPYDSQHTDFQIAAIRRKRSDGVIEWINIWSNAVYDPNMLNIIVSAYGADTEWYGLLVLDYWDWMRLTNPFENQYTTVGNVPKLESVYGIAVYDSTDGKVIHLHTILNMEGASPIDPQEKEKEVLEFLRTETDLDITKVSILHDPNLQDISANYYVNVNEKRLIKIPESEVQKRLKEPQKQS